MGEAEFFKHGTDTLLRVLLNEMHICLHVDQRELLDETLDKLNASIVGSYLSFEIGNIVF
jgi:hypothetical protein